MSTKQYENEDIKVEMERKPGSKVILTIDISPKAANLAYHQAIKAINKQVSLPGFRKGKAPEAMIAKQYQVHVEREFRDFATRNAFNEAVKLTNTYPYHERAISQPKLKTLTREEGGVLNIEFEAVPDVPEIDPTKLKLKSVKAKKIDKEQIDNALEDIRYQHAEWTDVTDRAVGENDYIEITIENIEGAEPVPLFQHTRFKVDEENMGNWMRKLVIGKKIGDQVEGVSEKETKGKKKDKSEDEFKPTKLRITIHKIQTAALPEVTDEFAKKLGLDNVDAIIEKVTGELERFAEEDCQEEMRKQLGEALLKEYHVDLPASMLQNDMKRASDAAVARIKAQAKEGEDVTAKAQAAAAESAKQIENSYQLYFILRKVANENNIDPSSQEVMHELMRQMFAVNPQQRIIDPQGDPQESRSRIHSYLVEQKAKDWLIEQATAKKEKA